MMESFLHNLGTGIMILATTLAGWLGVEQPSFGVTLPGGQALFETSLQERISSTDSSMTLVENELTTGESLSGYQCFTIDEGRSDAEFVCGTISGTTVSSLERGISASTGTSTVAAARFPHRRGATVKITDFPLIQRLRNVLNGGETVPNLLQYSTTTTVCSVSSSNFAICDKAYMDGVAVAGASNANTTTKGIVEIATDAENAAGTGTGGTSAILVVPSSGARSTPTANKIPVALSTGYLDENWFKILNIPSAGQIEVDGILYATTTKLGGTTVTWASTNNTASSTIPVKDGSGNMYWIASENVGGWQMIASTTLTSAANSISLTGIPARNLLQVYIDFGESSGNTAPIVRFNNDSGTNYGYSLRDGLGVTQASSSKSALGLTTMGHSETTGGFFTINISNRTSQIKRYTFSGGTRIDVAADSVVDTTGSGLWANTSSQITRIDLIMASGMTIPAGSTITVYGSNQ